MASPITFSLIVISLLFNLTFEQTLDPLDYDIYGDRLAVNENLLILTANEQNQFVILYSPYSSNSCIAGLPYSYPSQYVYTVAIGSNQNVNQSYFTYIAEYLNNDTVPPSIQVIFVVQEIRDCGGPADILRIVDLDPAYQRSAIFGMDPSGAVAFVISSTEIIYIEINANISYQTTICAPNISQFSPRAIVVDDNQTAHISGYACITQLVCFLKLITVSFEPLSTVIHCVMPNITIEQPLSGVLLLSTARTSDLSLSINTELGLLLLGVPHENIVYIYDYSFDSSNLSYTYISSFTSNEKEAGFGKSVAWLDNQTIAVLVYSLSTLPWSTSQVQVSRLFIYERFERAI